MSAVRIGQHFLINKNVAKKIVNLFFPVDGSILEIGPGKGILTDLLVENRGKNSIVAIELDEKFCINLKKKNFKNFEVIHSDILDIDLNHITVDKMVHIIGNIPYYISKELIDWVIFQSEWIKKGIFMMQKEFINKLASPLQSTHQNAQSVLFNYLFKSQKLFDVNPGSFYPKPGVRSTVFLFKKYTTSDEAKMDVKKFYRFLKTCFKSRRKILFNNLVSVIDRMRVNEVFKTCGINRQIRAGQLTGDKFLEIYKQINVI